MKKTVKYFILISLSFLYSCYTQQQIKEAYSALFIGQHYSNIVKSYGCPNKVIDDGSGGRFLEYDFTSTYYSPGYSQTNTYNTSTSTTTGNATVYDNIIWGNATTYSNGQSQSITTYTPSQTYNITHFYVFHINKEGIIKEMNWFMTRSHSQHLARLYYKSDLYKK
jgi:hypothetical protein